MGTPCHAVNYYSLLWICRSWTLSMLLKYTEDGHVVGVGSQRGHQITLSVQGGRMMVSLEGPNGTQETVTHTQQLERNVFTDVVSVWVHACVYNVCQRGVAYTN